MPAEKLRLSFPARPGPASVDEWLQADVLQAANDLIDAHQGRPLQSVALDWSLRGRTAGKARMLARGEGLIRLNRQLFDYRGDGYRELRDTVLHEIAHLCVASCSRRAAPHGRLWQAFAAALGAQPRATHTLPLAPARTTAEYAYLLGEALVWIGPVRHRRIQSGQFQYRIRRNGMNLPLEPAHYTGQSRRRTPRGDKQEC